MGRKSKDVPKDQVKDLPNEARINMLLQLGEDNDNIMTSLCSKKHNLAAIDDEAERKKLSLRHRVETPNFDRKFRQRLLEQIRKCKSKYKKIEKEFDLASDILDDDGSARNVSDIEIIPFPRFSTGIDALDEILGHDFLADQSGVPCGSCIILGAEKGVGKTRLSVEVASHVGRPGQESDHNGNCGVLFIQNEEKLEVFRSRAASSWTNDHDIKLSSSDDLNQQVYLVEKHRPKLVIIDSIQDTKQAKYSSGIRSMMMAYRAIAQSSGCAFWLISHLNSKGGLKGGEYAGYKVDIELIANRLDDSSGFSINCNKKNRYGATGKEAIFIHGKDSIISIG